MRAPWRPFFAARRSAATSSGVVANSQPYAHCVASRLYGHRCAITSLCRAIRSPAAVKASSHGPAFCQAAERVVRGNHLRPAASYCELGQRATEPSDGTHRVCVRLLGPDGRVAHCLASSIRRSIPVSDRYSGFHKKRLVISSACRAHALIRRSSCCRTRRCFASNEWASRFWMSKVFGNLENRRRA